MYHGHFRGTHYEAGLRWGSQLLKHKNLILDHVPFAVTEERLAYANDCLPVYREFYPEILEEIAGIADGQKCGERGARNLQAVLLSMYAMPPGVHCSCFAAASGDEIFLGRNSDFLPELERFNQNVIYRLDGAYTFTGNTTAFVEMEDGVNEHGLAVGLTSVYPTVRRPGFNAGMLVRYFLEKCRNVSEVAACFGRLPIGSAQTITAADADGRIAVFESCCERTEAVVRTLDGGGDCHGSRGDNHGCSRGSDHGGGCGCSHSGAGKWSAVCSTNMFHLPGMEPFNGTDIDDWFAEARYQTMVSAFSRFRAAPISSALPAPLAFSAEKREPDVDFAKGLLAGEFGFLCQYDRKTGKDTVWSVVYDLKRRRIYRCEGNPARRSFKEDLRFHEWKRKG